MEKKNITKEDFNATVELLKKEKREVSALNIREVLGRGSLTTITNFLKEYRQEQEEKALMPDIFKEKVNDLTQKLYNFLSEKFEKEQEALEQEHQETIKRLDGAIRSLDKIREDYEQENKTLKNYIADLEKENIQLKTKIDVLNETAKNNNTVSQEQFNEIVKAIKNISETKKEHKQKAAGETKKEPSKSSSSKQPKTAASQEQKQVQQDQKQVKENNSTGLPTSPTKPMLAPTTSKK